MPVDGVARAAINLTVVGNGNCLRAATRHAAAQLDVTLCEILKAKFAEDLQNLLAGENSQFGHHATASSSMVARIVGSLEKPSSERSSPSRWRPIASRILKASSSKVAACVTTGRSRHSATNWRSPLVMRTWIVRFIAGSPQITVCTTTALGRESKILAGGSAEESPERGQHALLRDVVVELVGHGEGLQHRDGGVQCGHLAPHRSHHALRTGRWCAGHLSPPVVKLMTADGPQDR